MELQASAGSGAFRVSSDGMLAEGGHGSGLQNGVSIAPSQLRTLLMDPLSAARVHLPPSTLAGRVLSAWVRERAMPALDRARSDMAASLQQLEARSLRAEEDLNPEADGTEEVRQGGRSLLADPSPDTITLAQIMSVLSSLDTLNVRGH